MSVRKGALLIPQRAVTDMQGKPMVAVVGADNKAEVRAVKVADRIGSDWVVEEGLKPGENVVAEGTQKVKPGMTVTPKPYTPEKADAQPGQQGQPAQPVQPSQAPQPAQPGPAGPAPKPAAPAPEKR